MRPAGTLPRLAHPAVYHPRHPMREPEPYLAFLACMPYNLVWCAAHSACSSWRDRGESAARRAFPSACRPVYRAPYSVPCISRHLSLVTCHLSLDLSLVACHLSLVACPPPG